MAAARWLIGTIAWSVLALAVFAPSLAVVTPGLPNDHYHAFLDPLVIALAASGSPGSGTGCGLPWLATWPAGPPRQSEQRRRARAPRTAAETATGTQPRPSVLLPRVAAVALTGLLVGVCVTAWPPAVSPDGGWRAAERAAAQIQAFAAGRPYALVGIPVVQVRRLRPVPALAPGRGSARPRGPRRRGSAGARVTIVCDPLFEGVVGAACGGPAEAAWLKERGLDLPGLAAVRGGIAHASSPSYGTP